MDRTERFYRIERLLRQRGCMALEGFLGDLGVSRATFKRDLEYLRDRMHAPIVWNRERGGYELRESGQSASWQLPGLWFSAQEIHALLMLEHLLETLQPGLLGRHVRPLRARVARLLESGDQSAAEVRRRIRVLPMAARELDAGRFETIASAVLARRRVLIRHYKRLDDSHVERVISPQRLVHHRYNWYVEAWCHLRGDLRLFAIDAIEAAQLTGERAKEVAAATLDASLGVGFGIFAGRAPQRAVLQFSPLRARWVSKEIWHPAQKGSLQLDGSYVLELPYGDERELLLEILKYGAHVKVLAPESLVTKVAAALAEAVAQYPAAAPVTA